MADTPACAIAVTEDNVNLILSEAGKKHTRADIEAWLREFGAGYFLRDPSNSALDCQFFHPLIFATHYKFKNPQDDRILFQEVIRIQGDK